MIKAEWYHVMNITLLQLHTNLFDHELPPLFVLREGFNFFLQATPYLQSSKMVSFQSHSTLDPRASFNFPILPPPLEPEVVGLLAPN